MPLNRASAIRTDVIVQANAEVADASTQATAVVANASTQAVVEVADARTQATTIVADASTQAEDETLIKAMQQQTDLEGQLKHQQEVSIELAKRLKNYLSVVKVDAWTVTETVPYDSEDNNKPDDNAFDNTVPDIDMPASHEDKTANIMLSGNRIYKCANCKKTYTKRSSFVDHQAEFCVGSTPVKDMACKFCQKPYTRRALRVHINSLIRGVENNYKRLNLYFKLNLKKFITNSELGDK